MDQEHIRKYSDRILSKLVDEGLVTSNYLLFGLCIMDALSQMLEQDSEGK